MSGSVSVAVTLAVLDSCPAACGVSVMFTMAVEPFAIEFRLHVIVVVPLHEAPWGGMTETSVGPAGNFSQPCEFRFD